MARGVTHFNPIKAHDFEPRFAQIEPHHVVAARLMRRQNRDPPGAKGPQRSDRRGRTHGYADAGALRQLVLQLGRRGNAAPEGFERNADDEMIQPRRHDLIDRGGDALAHGGHVLEESLLGIERPFFDGRARGMIGDAARAERLAFRLHRGVGRGHHDADAFAKSQSVGHCDVLGLRNGTMTLRKITAV